MRFFPVFEPIPFWIRFIEHSPIICQKNNSKNSKQHAPKCPPSSNMIQQGFIGDPIMKYPRRHEMTDTKHIQRFPIFVEIIYGSIGCLLYHGFDYNSFMGLGKPAEEVIRVNLFSFDLVVDSDSFVDPRHEEKVIYFEGNEPDMFILSGRRIRNVLNE